MSEFLASGWRITHLGVTVLDFGDDMSAEVKLPWQASGETAQVARAANAVQVDYGNVANALSFDRKLEFATAQLARDFALAQAAARSSAVGDATIESLSGAFYTLAAARIKSVDPRIEEGWRFVIDCTLRGGALTAFPVATKTANFTAVASTLYLCDTTGGAFTATLPAAPAVGDLVPLQDAGTGWGTHALTVARNGLLINGAAANYTANTAGAKLVARYISTGYGWQI